MLKILAKLTVALTLLVAPISSALATGDQELYDPAPPANAAFVRMIHASGDKAGTATLGGKQYALEAGTNVTAYQVVLAGTHGLAAGSLTQDITVEAGKYYTIALVHAGDKLTATVFDDMLMEKPSKAYLYFYNLSDLATASLHSPKHKADIVANVAARASNARAVNALTLDLTVVAGDKTIKSFAATELTRRAGFSVVLTGDTSAHDALLVKNDVKR